MKKIKKPKISGEATPQELHEQAEEDLLDLMDYCDEHKINILFLATPWKMSTEDAGRSRTVEKRLRAEDTCHRKILYDL